MTTTQSVWVPASNQLRLDQLLALSVPERSKPDRQEHRRLLAAKFQAMMDADPETAERGLQMSQEHAPGLYLVWVNHLRSELGQGLMNSDTVQSLLAQIDWAQPGSLEQAPEQNLLEMLEALA